MFVLKKTKNGRKIVPKNTNDDTEVGIGNKIPLWLFGFLY